MIDALACKRWIQLVFESKMKIVKLQQPARKMSGSQAKPG